MGNVIDFFKHQPQSLAKTQPKIEPTKEVSISKEQPEYLTSTKPAKKPPLFSLADDRSLYAYYQLTQAASLGKDTLDVATRLKSAALLGKIEAINCSQIASTIALNTNAPQKPATILLTDQLSATPKPLITCLSPSVYIQPFKYIISSYWKIISHLTGLFEVLLFDETGILIKRIKLGDEKYKVIEIPANIYYSIITQQPCSYLEICNSIDNPETDRNYAAWAAKENSAEAAEYLQRLYSATIGDKVVI